MYRNVLYNGYMDRRDESEGDEAMAMHSGMYGLVAAADRLPSCEECGYYLTNTDAGLVCTPCPKVEAEPTQEQQDALRAYIATREEVEGLRDDIYFANSFAEKDEASAKLGAARSAYAQATREATRLGVIEVGRALFR